MRVVFFGTPAFAVPTLEALLASTHTVVGVVTQPDKPRGRGQKTSDSAVKARALEAGVPVLQPAALKDPAFVTAFARFDADIGVIAAYGKILPESVINTPRLGMINVHASLLPKYRGAAPIHRAVIAGDSETGVTIMRVVKALDAGAMFATAKHPIGLDETSEDVECRLSTLGAALLVSTLDRIAAGPVVETTQSDDEATYASRLTKEDGAIDWSRPTRDLHNLIRGLHPWPHAYSYLGAHRIIVLKAAPSSAPLAGAPGTVVSNGREMHVATGDGSLQILELQVEGKRRMAAREFLAGHPIAPGERFSASA